MSTIVANFSNNTLFNDMAVCKWFNQTFKQDFPLIDVELIQGATKFDGLVKRV